MEKEYKQPSKFQRDWQGHYPVILIYLTLVIACVVVGKETNWQFFGFLMYALLAIGIMYLLCFLPWYFISLKEDSLSSGFKTSTRGISLILGLTCAFLLMFKTWGDWHLGSSTDDSTTDTTTETTDTTTDEDNNEDIIVYVSKAGKYHKKTCKYYHKGMKEMTLSEAVNAGIIPGQCCNR